MKELIKIIDNQENEEVLRDMYYYPEDVLIKIKNINEVYVKFRNWQEILVGKIPNDKVDVHISTKDVKIWELNKEENSLSLFIKL